MGRLRCGMARLKHAVWHRRRDRSHGLLNVSEGVVVLHVRKGVLRRKRFLSGMGRHILLVLLVVIVITTAAALILEVYRPLVLVWLSILLIMSVFQGWGRRRSRQRTY